jgi:hypothetical protein
MDSLSYTARIYKIKTACEGCNAEGEELSRRLEPFEIVFG